MANLLGADCWQCLGQSPFDRWPGRLQRVRVQSSFGVIHRILSSVDTQMLSVLNAKLMSIVCEDNSLIVKYFIEIPVPET